MLVNCTCEDDWPQRTLLDMRTALLRRLGFSAQAANPPPGMAELLDDFLRDAQEQLYWRYKALRTERFYTWPLFEGERFYALGGNREDYPVALTAANNPAMDMIGYADAVERPIVFGAVSGTVAGAIVTMFLYSLPGRHYVVGLQGVQGAPAPDFWQTVEVPLPDGDTLILTAADADDFDYGTAELSGRSYWYFNAEIADNKLVPGNYQVTFRGVDGADVVPAYTLSPNKMSWIGIEDLNARWYPLVPGIPPDVYTTPEQRGLPSRYEIRQCIELWPPPDADGYRLRIKGHFGLEPFTDDAHLTTIDPHPVFLFALGQAKAHYGKPDANNYFAQALNYIASLVAGSHHGARYVPHTIERTALPRPRFLPLE